MTIHRSNIARPPSGSNSGIIFGFTRRQRFAFYRWLSFGLVVFSVFSVYVYLQPHRWYTYTDVVSFQQSAHDVRVGYVLWQPAESFLEGLSSRDLIAEPCLSADGTRLFYAGDGKDRSSDLFYRNWDGVRWSDPKPMRALNSKFDETSPSLSRDGNLLFFSSNRPGGAGGYDIWVARWDGVDYAWPLPLTNRVNTRFDERGPAISPDDFELYFASNRPRQRVDESISELTESEIDALKTDYDIYSAHIAGVPPYELMVERQLSMLYSLRELALGDTEVMRKLGGTADTEAAVDQALAYLASIQSEDGRWDMSEHGGKRESDMAGTGAALLAFYGRGQRHDIDCQYQEVVQKGILWLTEQQDKVSGDLRGTQPRGRMYDHGIAALAIVEAYGVTKDSKLRPRAQSAIEFIEVAQHSQGGWRYAPGERGDLSVSGWMIMVLASAKMSGLQVQQETIDDARRFLDRVSGGRRGGAFGYTDTPGMRGHSPAMNAVGFFCRQLLGLSNHSALAREASSLLDGRGFDRADHYYAYYGTLASYQQQGPTWRRWRDSMQSFYLRSQRSDGAWTAQGGLGREMGTIVATALVTLCLEAHYRYTPLYGLGFEPAEGETDAIETDLMDFTQIREVPLFRHAQNMETLSSPANEMDPVVTMHGDFLYFASDRDGGFGGSDLYRSRFQRQLIDDEDRLIPGDPVNLGSEINSESNEYAPALRWAGFQLLFNKDEKQNASSLYASTSKRVVRQHSLFIMPDAMWLATNAPWLAGFFIALIVLAITTQRAINGKATTIDLQLIATKLSPRNWQR